MRAEQVRDTLNEIADKIEDLQNIIKTLREENKELKSEHYKDEELARLKEAYNDLWEDYLNSFSLSDKDKEKLNCLFKAHCLQHPDETNSLTSATKCNELGDDVYKIIKYPRHRIASYEFIPTEIDIFIRVKCNCGEVFDIN